MMYDIVMFFKKLSRFIKAVWRFRKLLWGYISNDFVVPLQFFHLSLEDLYKEMKTNKDMNMISDETLNDMRQILRALRRLATYNHFQIALRSTQASTSFNYYLEKERELELKDLRKIFNEKVAVKSNAWWV